MSNCKRCSTELVKDEDRGCSFCPLCHPKSKQALPVQELPKNYIDVKPNEMRKEEIIKIIKNIVPDLIREELENWHIKKPLVDEPIPTKTEPIVEDNPDWRVEAKRLNIKLYDKENNKPRKKVDVLLDIEKQRMTQ